MHTPMNHLVDLMLERRGLSWEDLARMDDGSHRELAGMPEAVRMLKELHDSGSRVVVLPDFDMDGIMSCTVLYAGLSELGFDVGRHVPDARAGYGFGAADIDAIVASDPSVSCILTCDVGITCSEGVARAKEMGLSVIVTDHHMPAGELPPADVIVDPCREDDGYLLKGICGAHVAWQLLDAYARAYCDAHAAEQIRRLRVFAGIGTVSDSMPLLYENRQLVRDAISIARLVWGGGDPWVVDAMLGCDEYRGAFHGLFCACEAWAESGTLRMAEDIDESFFGFYLAPMFNACKRLGEDMAIAYGAFLHATDSDRHDACMALMRMNMRRRVIVAEAVDSLRYQDNPLAPYAYVADNLPGVMGLIANKMLTGSGPVLVVRDDGQGLSGSGRSPSWYDALSALRGQGHFAAGHEQAFGCRFADIAELRSAAAFLERDSSRVRASLPESEVSGPGADIEIALDGTGDVGADVPLLADFVRCCEGLKPFGNGFPEPSVLVRFAAEDASWVRMGENRQHLKCVLPRGLELVFWNQAQLADVAQMSPEVCGLGKLAISWYRGHGRLQFTGDLLLAGGGR